MSSGRGATDPTRWQRWGPRLLVLASVGYGLYVLRPCLAPVVYPNDSAMHEQMVRFALERIKAGHSPLGAWYPWLNLGSPHFLHYQSTPAILTAFLALAVGPTAAFTWTFYLLLACWPIAVFLAAKLLGWDRWAAAAAAAVALLVVSRAGVGYEIQSYVWYGSGVWTQLFAMWTLPFAWGFSWKAIAERRHYLAAVLFLALTTAFHFESTYMALVAIPVFCLVRPGELVGRLRRGFLLVVGWFAAASFVLVPLIGEKTWAARNELAVGTYFYDSFSPGRILGWLFTGRLFDSGRLVPVVSLLAAVGLVTCVVRFRRDERARVLVLVFVVCLLLFLGPAGLGPAITWLPGSHDIFFRRYVAGVELAGMMLAGVGSGVVVRAVLRLWASRAPRTHGLRVLRRAVVLAAIVGALAPAWLALSSYTALNAQAVSLQQGADTTEGASANLLIHEAEAIGGGRIYAGLPTNWGNDCLVGSVPMYLYLASQDADEVGLTLRTASLMSDVEPHFDGAYAGDFELFGIRFLIAPSTFRPAVRARRIATAGRNTLFEVGRAQTNSFVQVVDTFGHVTENRTNIGVNTSFMLGAASRSWSGRALYPTVAYDGAPAAPGTIGSPSAVKGPPGSVVSQRVDLVDGVVRAEVDAARRAVVLLKVSYDPGWHATVDGVPEKPEMIAPALVGVVVPPGLSSVVFTFEPYQHYDVLFAVSGLTLVAFAAGPAAWGYVSRRRARPAARHGRPRHRRGRHVAPRASPAADP